MKRLVARVLILTLLVPLAVPDADPCVERVDSCGAGHEADACAGAGGTSAPDVLTCRNRVDTEAAHHCVCLCHSRVLTKSATAVPLVDDVAALATRPSSPGPDGFRAPPFRPPRLA